MYISYTYWGSLRVSAVSFSKLSWRTWESQNFFFFTLAEQSNMLLQYVIFFSHYELRISFFLQPGLHLYRSWWPLVVYSGGMQPGKQRWQPRQQDSMCHTERWASDPWCSSGRAQYSSSLLKPAAQRPAVWPLARGDRGPDEKKE